MKRRHFILSATAVTGAAIGVPWFYGNSKSKALIKNIPKPIILSTLCTPKEIIEIGNAYRIQFPAENSAVDLAALIADGDGFPDVEQTAQLTAFIEQKILNDFQENKTVIVKGWVLSATEARQCALLTTIQPS